MCGSTSGLSLLAYAVCGTFLIVHNRDSAPTPQLMQLKNRMAPGGHNVEKLKIYQKTTDPRNTLYKLPPASLPISSLSLPPTLFLPGGLPRSLADSLCLPVYLSFLLYVYIPYCTVNATCPALFALFCGKFVSFPRIFCS